VRTDNQAQAETIGSGVAVGATPAAGPSPTSAVAHGQRADYSGCCGLAVGLVVDLGIGALRFTDSMPFNALALLSWDRW
jgi:hypothetical protein